MKVILSKKEIELIKSDKLQLSDLYFVFNLIICHAFAQAKKSIKKEDNKNVK